MRLTALHLERYGHFTDRSLAFRADARLHVVYGPNEAGKSSALSAVTDLLFGLTKKSPYDFQRDGREMSLGAEISGGGQVLRFHRRRGTKRTLFDADGEPLGEDALVPYLGGLTRDVFCRAFGLDAPALRAGGDEMLKSDGEIGESLFAAASGLRGMSDTRRRLEEEAEAIYAPRGRNRVVNQLIDRREQARKAIKSGEVRAPAWKQLNESIAGQTARLDEISQSRMALLAEEARLKRLKRVAPLLQQIDGLIEESDGFSGLPEIGEAAIERLGQLLAERRAGQEERHRTGAALARAEAELARVSLDEALLAEAPVILGLFSAEGAYAKDQRDLPRIAAEADEFHAALARLAVRIGLDDVAMLEGRQPSEAAKARVEGQIASGRKLQDAAAALEQELAEAQDRLATLKRQRAEGGGLTDPTPLRSGLEALGPVLRELHRRDDLAREIQDEARALSRAAARLNPPVADLPALARTALPEADALAAFTGRFEALTRKTERSRERDASARAAHAEIEARLRSRERAGAVPTAEALAALRADRDADWRVLRGALTGAGPLGPNRLIETIAGFERSAAEADRLADSMAADAQRAAEQAADLARLADEVRSIAAAEAELAATESRQAELDADWAAFWSVIGVQPRSPAEMTGWLGEVRALLARSEALETRRDELERVTARIDSIRPALLDLARNAGEIGLDTLDVPLLAGHLTTRLAALTAAWDAARDAEARLRAAEDQVAQLHARLERAREAAEAWRPGWGATLADLGLLPDAGLAEAEAALAAWREVPDKLSERDNRERRVAGMRRDIAEYETRARALVETLAPDMLELPPDAAIGALHKRLEGARAAEARRSELRRQHETQDEAARLADERLGLTLNQIEAFAANQGVAPDDDLDGLHERLAARQALQKTLATRRAELSLHAEHVDEAALRDELAALAPGEIDAGLARLRLEQDGLDRAGQEAYAEKVELERRRRELEEGVGAEIAVAQKRAAEAELKAAARRWAVLKLGAALLATAMERHRTGQQDPLITRAGALFHDLTGGGFAGLAQDYDEEDVPRLAGRRALGELVRLDGLSEGTRDQLYLALRLAYLEDYARRAEPAPFIGDDIFSTFDEGRTANGLRALASIGDRVQPILFTHHRHVAELAEAELGGAVDIVQL